MNKTDIINITAGFVGGSKDNYTDKGIRIFDSPVFAFGGADNPGFEALRQPAAVGQHFMLPGEWLPGAKTVITFFLPFGEEVRKSNAGDMSYPSEEWLYARIEGQAFLNSVCRHLQSGLIAAGFNTVVPSLDSRFWNKTGLSNEPGEFTSNWSERHVGFVCGLGTFGLSRGLITRKGMAGRLGSVVTELSLEPDIREYGDIYEYCSMCGVCVRNCPASAISVESGKNHVPCSAFLDEIKIKSKPRYGCGKCQVKVPCESRIPKLPGS